MDWSKFASRKLIATVACVVAVVVADLVGMPLDEPTLDAITNMVLGLVGAQGLVDTAGAWKAGNAIADAAIAGKELIADASDADAEDTA